jgi:hypothetical protein
MNDWSAFRVPSAACGRCSTRLVAVRPFLVRVLTIGVPCFVPTEVGGPRIFATLPRLSSLEGVGCSNAAAGVRGVLGASGAAISEAYDGVRRAAPAWDSAPVPSLTLLFVAGSPCQGGLAYCVSQVTSFDR